ncbi:MarR family transcriptional regulator [Streptomyces sp. NBC_00631]|uniref:MarR family winged helix-turn-helix transcriptional regulator n=1 Tax=Streptomyces sp. NBC_00631 TaxID=2975793 RepID=UPI0030E359FD
MRLPDDLSAYGDERLRTVLRVDLGLLAVADRLRQHWAARASAVGLSNAQVKVLLLLAPGETVSMRGLAVRLDYDASNLSTLVDRLERRGAVERRADPRDRRIKALALTAEGERLRETFWRGLVEDPGPLSPLGEDQLRALASLLDVLNTADASAPAAP